MTSHVLRPLLIAACLGGLVLVARSMVVPDDFGVGPTGYMYGWHRRSNQDEWKQITPRYRTSEYCRDCHAENYGKIHASVHKRIACENCHGPALGHPEKPPKLVIHREREHCLRCHAALPYPRSGRAQVPGIDPARHNPGVECATCHNPHSPNLGG